MRIAESADKNHAVKILTSAFKENRSVNYVIKQGQRRLNRIHNLMAYSFDYCSMFGKVYMSDDNNACCLVMLPDKKKVNFRSIMLDIHLILTCVGLFSVKKVLEREKQIARIHPGKEIYYLWFIGVDPTFQGNGIGAKFLSEIIADSHQEGRPIYLETSTEQNISFYKRFGFKVYKELNFGFPLFCLKS